jgi:prepilin-type N-terminal cleavage/methylation domain-containing protein
VKIKRLKLKNRPGAIPQKQAGMTLVEVLVALVITGLAVGGIVSGYGFCTISARKAAMTQAANARAMERIEETRSSKWDTASWPMVDELVATNFPVKTIILDPSRALNMTNSATLQTVISQISTTPPLRRIRVDCIWTFNGERLTNTIETCRAPDQ